MKKLGKKGRAKKVKWVSEAQARGIQNVARIEYDYLIDHIILTTASGKKFGVKMSSVLRQWEKRLKWADDVGYRSGFAFAEEEEQAS